MSAATALAALLRGASIDDHGEALQLAQAAAQAAATPDARLAAQHTKVVALLKLDRFDDALRAIADGGDALAARCTLERAYALYKTGDLDGAQAATAAAAAGSTHRALQHVAAQAAYRAEHFDRAAALYAQLRTDADEALDVRINTLAVAASAARGGDTTTADLDSFETAYNAGTAALTAGDAARASVLLRRAQQLCEASDDLDDDDKRAELLPILVQHACALARLGRRDEAAALQRAAASLSPSAGSAPDPDATAVLARANDAVLAYDAAHPNPYLLQRALAAVPPPPRGSDRLFGYQARLLRRNQYAVDLQCYKFKGVQARAAHRLSAAEADHVTTDDVDLGVFYAAAQAAMQTGRDALRRLQAPLARRPNDVGLLLTAIQLHLRAQNPAAAVQLLEAFFDRAAARPAVRFAPGLVALAVALYRLQGRRAAVRAELAAAVTHWSSSDAAVTPPSSLLRAAGIELLRSPSPADRHAAATAFARLQAADPSDRVAAAGIIAASDAVADQDVADAALPPVDALVRHIDVAALLQSGVAVLAPATATAAVAATRKRTRDAEDSTAPTKKAKTQAAAAATKLSRQARKLQAKDVDGSTFDPNKKLDAERWLPLRDRSSYRPPKGKKGRRRGGEAATMQGGVVREEETLALAGGAGSVKVEKAPPGGGSAAAKKRKKGKK